MAASLPHPAGALETAGGRRPVHAKDMASPCISPKSCPDLFCLPSANWAVYSMTRTYMIKAKKYSRPYDTLLFFNVLICTRPLWFLLSTALPSSPPSPQDFCSLSVCHIGKLAVRKAPLLFLRRWISYKHEALVLFSHVIPILHRDNAIDAVEDSFKLHYSEISIRA